MDTQRCGSRQKKFKRSNVVSKNRTAANDAEVSCKAIEFVGRGSMVWRLVCDACSRAACNRRSKFIIAASRTRRRWGGESLRLTIDSQLQASRARGWRVASTSDAASRTERVDVAEVEILELKFHNQMPHLFKELLRTFPLRSTGFSKYSNRRRLLLGSRRRRARGLRWCHGSMLRTDLIKQSWVLHRR